MAITDERGGISGLKSGQRVDGITGSLSEIKALFNRRSEPRP